MDLDAGLSGGEARVSCRGDGTGECDVVIAEHVHVGTAVHHGVGERYVSSTQLSDVPSAVYRIAYGYRIAGRRGVLRGVSDVDVRCARGASLVPSAVYRTGDDSACDYDHCIGGLLFLLRAEHQIVGGVVTERASSVDRTEDIASVHEEYPLSSDGRLPYSSLASREHITVDRSAQNRNLGMAQSQTVRAASVNVSSDGTSVENDGCAPFHRDVIGISQSSAVYGPVDRSAAYRGAGVANGDSVRTASVDVAADGTGYEIHCGCTRDGFVIQLTVSSAEHRSDASAVHVDNGIDGLSVSSSAVDRSADRSAGNIDSRCACDLRVLGIIGQPGISYIIVGRWGWMCSPFNHLHGAIRFDHQVA